MKLACIFFVLIGACLGMAAKTTVSPTTAVNGTTVVIETTVVNETTAMMSTTPIMTTMSTETTFRLDDAKGSACILEQMQAEFSIEYDMINAENKTVPARITYTLPQVAKVDSSRSACAADATNTSAAVMPMLTLTFDQPELGNNFEQYFTMSANDSALTNITLALNHTEALFPNSTQMGKLVMYSATLPSATFMVNSGNSYLCNAHQYFKLGDNANVTFSKVKVQTAGIVDNKFGNVSQCPQDIPATSAAPTSTMMPPTVTPTSFPPAESWNITHDNKTCMIIKMSLQFNISYINAQNKTNVIQVDLPKDANDAGSVCGESNTTSKFVLTFFDAWSLELDFSFNTTTKVYNNTNMELFYTFDDHFTNPMKSGNATATIKNSGITAPEGKCYSCNAEQQLKADDVIFILHDVKIQPFALQSNGTYGPEAPCEADNQFNNIVPIAVGCALAGLVIIVLIAYLIGRQRSSKSGYESV